MYAIRAAVASVPAFARGKVIAQTAISGIESTKVRRITCAQALVQHACRRSSEDFLSKSGGIQRRRDGGGSANRSATATRVAPGLERARRARNRTRSSSARTRSLLEAVEREPLAEAGAG